MAPYSASKAALAAGLAAIRREFRRHGVAVIDAPAAHRDRPRIETARRHGTTVAERPRPSSCRGGDRAGDRRRPRRGGRRRLHVSTRLSCLLITRSGMNRSRARAANRKDSMTKLPATRPSRVVIEPVSPVVDGGRFAAKVSLGEPVTVVADVFGEGHDAVDAAIRWRQVTPERGAWQEAPLTFHVNDRWSGSFAPDALGRWEYQIMGWSAGATTWRNGLRKKIAADVDVTAELLDGVAVAERLLTRAGKARPKQPEDIARLEELRDAMRSGGTPRSWTTTDGTTCSGSTRSAPRPRSPTPSRSTSTPSAVASARGTSSSRDRRSSRRPATDAARRDRPARSDRGDGVRRGVPATDPPDR
jgi:hypothetical protein